jgi:hypothetical protein
LENNSLIQAQLPRLDFEPFESPWNHKEDRQFKSPPFQQRVEANRQSPLWPRRHEQARLIGLAAVEVPWLLTPAAASRFTVSLAIAESS